MHAAPHRPVGRGDAECAEGAFARSRLCRSEGYRQADQDGDGIREDEQGG